ncbi:MAG: adenosylcobinamide-phosphate synthase CbiB [Thermoanaerobacteraceae bacterium]|nr:adenosylcobinamide-phosphate synthase CbiB [Thermoanaerobacteraceae bacterium]
MAFVLDLIFGDPPFRLHPVRIIGTFIKYVENIVYPMRFSELLKGIFLLTVTALPAFFVPYFILRLLSPYPMLYHAANIIIIYFCLSLKDLRDETIRVYQSLKDNNIETARDRLAMIVGRDTENMDEKEIVRAAVETVAENIVDGFISPLFYIFLFGAPGGLAFKAVSTLDSMVGYKNKRYMYFGRPSAIADDILNFIPARLSLLLIPVASLFVGMNSMRAFRIGMRDRLKNPSPNSGHGEACFAGAMDVQLGGLNYYAGTPSMKPIIGDKGHELQGRYIIKAVNLAYATGVVTLIIFCGVSYLYAGTWW